MKKIIIYAIFLSFMLLPNMQINAKVHDRKAIEQCLDNFFIDYFNAYKSLDNSKAIKKSRDNEHLYAFQKYHEVEVKFLKELDLIYKDIKYKVDYYKIQVNYNSAAVGALVDMTFKYNHYESIESGIYNISFDFFLRKDQDRWYIEKVESDYEKYMMFMEDVNRKRSKSYEEGFRKELSFGEATDEVFDEHMKRIYEAKVKKTAIHKGYFRANSLEDKRIYSGKVEGYLPEIGVEYALKFAESPIDKRFFYTTKANCTNFVSQCVWAALGGYDSKDPRKVAENIRKRYKMTDIWYGNTGGGTPSWESVERFYSYFISEDKEREIDGEVQNNDQLAVKLDPVLIKPGEVLQFRNGNKGPYTHSVYVTSNTNNGDFSGIFVCQQSTDWKNRNLEDLILSPGWGGYDKCYMRRIYFKNK